MPAKNNTNIALMDAMGTPLTLSLRELSGFLASKQGIGFLLLAVALLLMSDPPGLLSYMAIHEALLVWVLALGCYLVSFFLVTHAASLLQHKRRVGRIWTPAVGLICIGPVVCQSEMLVRYIVGPEYQIVILRKIVFYYFIVQIIEFAFIRLILPTMHVEEQDAEPDIPERTFWLGDRELRSLDLHYVEAKEHYVRVVMKEDEILHRQRLGDLVAQLDPMDGLQPHRSWWVSRYAAPRAEKINGRVVLITFDGTQIPVARGRYADVEAWLSALPDVADPNQASPTRMVRAEAAE
ncbi:LytTR family DNA-binding domain-containing protein [Primorskyibacter sp. S187A]|uniref:LytTR family DNA-binding domain-containing protein n=1 Tax=Primorskyibacter sp. S187A TaxID=3415130 RepID=UPI003C7DC4F4